MKNRMLSGIIPLLLALWLAPPPAGAAGNPSLAEQLAQAQEDKDQAAIVELCRRQLEGPAANAAELLTTMYQAQVELGDYTRAAQTLDRLEKASPTPPAGQVADWRGDLAVKAEKLAADSIAYWREALKARPDNAPAILGKIADACAKSEDWAAGVEALRASLQMKPDHAARHALLAGYLLNTGDLAGADKEIITATRLDAADDTVKAVAPVFDRLRPQLPALRALETQAAKGKPGAAYDFRTGAKTSEAAHLDRALIFYRAGAYRSALPDLQAAADATGDTSLTIRLLRAQCLWLTDHAKEAIALRVAQIGNGIWFDDRARVDHLRAADTPAGNGGISAKQHIARAGVLLDAGQPVLLLEEVEAGIRGGEASGTLANEAQLVFAAALFQNDRTGDALATAVRITEMDGKNADAWALRGRLEQEARADFAAAVNSLSRAIAIRSEPPWVRRREVCLRTLGRNAEADRDAARLASVDR